MREAKQCFTGIKEALLCNDDSDMQLSRTDKRAGSVSFSSFFCLFFLGGFYSGVNDTNQMKSKHTILGKPFLFLHYSIYL